MTPLARPISAAPTAAGRVALAVLPVALLAALGWSRRWMSDDGFVVLRVTRNLLAGEGPVLNVGERVEAFASPLWLALLALARALAPAGVHLEWLAAGLGLALSVGGLACAVLAAWRLWAPERAARSRPPLAVLPLGALVVAVLPPFWDYATAGLETGLASLWLGATYLALVSLAAASADDGAVRSAAGVDDRRRADAPGGEPTLAEGLRSPPVLAVAIGLGPLIRPDLIAFAPLFLVALIQLARARTRPRAAVLVLLAAAPALAYQVFRMGYFASLVPNGALARELGAPAPGLGWDYLLDTVSPYALWLPLAALVAWATLAGRGLWRRGDHRRPLLVAAPIGGALVHALLVVGAGGDEAHARLLLPSVLGALLPTAVVVVGRRWQALPVAALVVGWAVACGLLLRAPAEAAEPAASRGGDERRLAAEAWGPRHPVTLDGVVAEPGRRLAIERRQGLELARLAVRRRAIVLRFAGGRSEAGEALMIPRPLPEVAPRRELPSEVVARLGGVGAIGRVGYAAGANVRIVDASGPGDPLAARMRAPARPSRPPRAGPGRLAPEWLMARYASPTTPRAAAWLRRDPGVSAARRALACPPLRELVAATSADLTLRRFLRNLVHSIGARALRLSNDPRRAAEEVCRERG